MKKFINAALSYVLAIAVLFSLVGANFVVKANNEEGYILYETGKEEAVLKSSDSIDFVNKFNAYSFEDDKSYKLVLNKDLVIPLDDSSDELASLKINCNISIYGNEHKITGANDESGRGRFIYIRKGRVSFENLEFDGSNQYEGIMALAEDQHSINLEINKCKFINCYPKGYAGTGSAIVFFSKNLDASLESNLKIQNTSFKNCFSSGGGAICAESVTSIILDGSEFIDCTSDGSGGAIYLKNIKNTKISSSKFIRCKSNEYPEVGGAIYLDNKNFNYGAEEDNLALKIDKSKFIDCECFEQGGALSLYNANFSLNDVEIRNCSVIHRGGAIYASDCFGTIIKSNFEGNKATDVSGGAICFENYYKKRVSKIIDSSFKNNSASEGGAVYTDGMQLEIDGSSFTGNRAIGGYGSCNGGALFLLQSYETTANIKNSTFTNNIALRAGGAIYTGDNTLKINDSKFVRSLVISDDVAFKGNKAGLGFYNPPKGLNFYKGKSSSTDGKLLELDGDKIIRLDSLLNNYDINYIHDKVYTVYDPNGGEGKLIINVYDINEDSYQIDERKEKVKKLEETGFKNKTKFLGWNTEADASGEWIKEEKELEVKGNLYLFAIWEKPQEYTTLTLDENYKGGKITEKDVMPGDMIEPHLYKPKRRGFTFKGWSYNKKHLDKVHYGDRIYEPTTVYAIWDEVEEEPEEIKALKHKAYIFGYPDGTVRPNGEITRAEAAAMLARLLEIESIGSADKPMFPDTPSAWYNKAINAVVQRGIMKGYPDGTFKPNDAITRAEFTQMISTIDNKPYGTAPFADVIGHWAERPIGSEYQAGRILGYPDGTFRPDSHITRCEAAVILNKIFERNFDAMSLLKCKNPMMIEYFTDLDISFWGYNDLVEATNTHEYVRRVKGRVEENWLLIK